MSVSIGVNIQSEATAASSSSCASFKSSPEKIQHKRKRRRRRHIENVLSIDNAESKSNIIVDKASNKTIIESVTALPSPPTLPPLPSSQEKMKHKKKRKTRRRRKEKDIMATKDDTSLSLQYNRTESTNHNTSSDQKLVQTTEEFHLETNLYANDEDNNNTATETILSNETLATCDGKETCEAVESNALLSQSQSNATNTTDKESVQEPSGSIKAAEKKQNKLLKNKKKRPPIKKPNASKSTTTSSTGKEGECLRRIKHEWKNAVKSGIAYDWINMKTIRNTNTTNSAYVRIGPFGKNLLRWHFSVSGPANSVYENGIYHGRVLLPKDYPASPPRVQMITPSGRFIPGEDICLSASSYHPETWTPRWTVLSLVDALRLHMLTTANEIGGVLASDEKRRQYAIESRSWKCHGIANHERMVAENIFVLQNLDSDGDDDVNNSGEKANSDENSNNAIVPDKLDMRDVIKCEKERDLSSNEEVIKDSLPQPFGEREKDASKRTSGRKKISTKQKKSKDSEDEESNNSVSAISSEKDPSIPASTNNMAKERKKKLTVAFAAETAVVEDSAQHGIHTKEAPNTRRSTKKKNRKEKSTGASTVETVECLSNDVRSKEGASNKRTSTKKKKRNRKKTTGLQIEQKEHNIQTIVLKRLLVEMLKLPLRVLAILIRILDRLENFMRAILDSI